MGERTYCFPSRHRYRLGVSSFLQLVEDLLHEPGERAAYLADPSGYLPSRGFGDFSTDDLELSMQLVSNVFPPALAELLDPAQGLDAIVAIDPADLPGLLAQPLEEPSGLNDILGEDDPFFDESANEDADVAFDSPSESSESSESSDDESVDLEDSNGEGSENQSEEVTLSEDDDPDIDGFSPADPADSGVAGDVSIDDGFSDDGFTDDSPAFGSGELSELDAATLAGTSSSDLDDGFE